MTTQPGAVSARRFGITPATATDQIQNPPRLTVNQSFEPLPTPTGPPPFRLALPEVIGPAGAGPLTFHCVGDSGGIKDPHPQLTVAAAMTADLANDPTPSFLYHLGDVVYFNGDESEYGPQFYEPYAHYNVPIFAIPGNHDGDNSDNPAVASLTAFVQNFCSATPHIDPRFHEYNRDTMDQPNVYWTLQAPPFLTIIGLYTNVPGGGEVHQDQIAWLVNELKAADPALPVAVALHHPPLSADAHHGSSPRAPSTWPSGAGAGRIAGRGHGSVVVQDIPAPSGDRRFAHPRGLSTRCSSVASTTGRPGIGLVGVLDSRPGGRDDGPQRLGEVVR